MTRESQAARRVVALAGGVGAARLVDGLDQALPADALTVVVNTGDDFKHWGLHVSPDLDTIMYTLAGLSPIEQGWGIEGDTFEVLDEMERRGADAWFRLGDRDLATHLFRSTGMAAGAPLTKVTKDLCQQLGITRAILPMASSPRPTIIETADGSRLAFQDWLVRQRAAPEVRRVESTGATAPTPEVLRALDAAELVVICPSNPYVSIDPILSLHGLHEILRARTTVAVSPILGGKAVKGPLAAMVSQIDGAEASARHIAQHYGNVLDGFVVQAGDAFEAPFPVLETNILIQSRESRLALARELLEFSRGLR